MRGSLKDQMLTYLAIDAFKTKSSLSIRAVTVFSSLRLESHCRCHPRQGTTWQRITWDTSLDPGFALSQKFKIFCEQKRTRGAGHVRTLPDGKW
jgi:hypothetical protein